MAANQRAIVVPAGSELALTLKAAHERGNAVVIDTGEGRYTIIVAMAQPSRNIFAYYDPRVAIARLQALDSALARVGRERLLRDLRAQRIQNSSGQAMC